MISKNKDTVYYRHVNVAIYFTLYIPRWGDIGLVRRLFLSQKFSFRILCSSGVNDFIVPIDAKGTHDLQVEYCGNLVSGLNNYIRNREMAKFFLVSFFLKQITYPFETPFCIWSVALLVTNLKLTFKECNIQLQPTIALSDIFNVYQ